MFTGHLTSLAGCSCCCWMNCMISLLYYNNGAMLLAYSSRCIMPLSCQTEHGYDCVPSVAGDSWPGQSTYSFKLCKGLKLLVTVTGPATRRDTGSGSRKLSTCSQRHCHNPSGIHHTQCTLVYTSPGSYSAAQFSRLEPRL